MEEKYINQGVCECLSIFFSLCRPVFREMTAKEIEAESGFKPDKVYRYLKTLEHMGMVRKFLDRWECSPEIVRVADGFKRHIARKRSEIEAKEREYFG
jgi:DNA-binding IclR family transcriptional regulator